MTARTRNWRARVAPGLAALGIALGIALGGAPARAQADLPVEIEDLDLNARPDTTITVTAPRELVGRELTAENFSVFEDEIRRPVSVTRLHDDGLEVVLVIDTSGSMQGEALAAAQLAAGDFVGAMPPGTRIAVVAFGDQPTVSSPFTTDTEGLVGAVEGLKARGETALYDALIAAVAQFDVGTNPGARRFVVLLSDGGDTASERTLEEAASGLSALDPGFYAVALATGESDLGALGQLAVATDGKVVAAGDPSEIAAVYDSIASQLVNQYRLRYRSGSEGETTLEVAIQADGLVARSKQIVELPPLPEAAPPPKPVVARPFTAPGPGLLERGWLLTAGVAAMVLALAVAGWLIGITRAPRRRRLARELGVSGQESSLLAGVADRAASMAERALEQGGRSGRLNDALEKAGLNMRPGEFVVLAATAVCGGTVVALLAVGPFGALAAAGLLSGVAGGGLSVARARRQRRLADQLGDTLQLLAGSLRSGHGLVQALDMVTREAESPTAEEFHRVIVETRLGRDLGDALQALAERAGNDDIEWVVQAIRIHREVGGDLAEILDRVGETIRDRNRVRGQVRSLTAEGRLSAIILMGLPFLVGGWMWLTNRPYVAELTNRPQGRAVLAVGAVLMTIGGFVLRRLVRPEF